MASQELLDYILQSRNASISDQVIRSNLIGGGWQQGDVDLAFLEAAEKSFYSQIDTPNETASVSQSTSSAQLGIIRSASSGALVPLLYSGFMRMWKVFAFEVWIFLIPTFLSFVSDYLPQKLAAILSFYFIWLILIPIFSFAILLFKVLRAKRIAWKARHWTGFEQFLAVQKRWDIAGRIALIFLLVPVIGVAITLGLTSFHG